MFKKNAFINMKAINERDIVEYMTMRSFIFGLLIVSISNAKNNIPS